MQDLNADLNMQDMHAGYIFADSGSAQHDWFDLFLSFESTYT